MTRMKRCLCGSMAIVDRWSNDGVTLRCPECGIIDLDRDDLYFEGLMARQAWLIIQHVRNDFIADADNVELDDDYRSCCDMIGSRLNDVIGLANMLKNARLSEAENVDEDSIMNLF